MNNPSFEELYKLYYPKLLTYLSKLTGKDDVKDIAQEVMLKVYQSYGTYRGDSKLSTWIYRIATHYVFDEHKKAVNRRIYSKTSSLDYIQPLKIKKEGYYSDDVNIEYTLFKEEMNQCIADYINKLQDLYRSIFLLSEYENLPVTEISEITGLTVDNVKIRLHRARKRLHELLLNNCSFYFDECSRLCCEKK